LTSCTETKIVSRRHPLFKGRYTRSILSNSTMTNSTSSSGCTNWRRSRIQQFFAVDIFANVEHFERGRLCRKRVIFVARMSNVLSTFGRLRRIRLCRQCVPGPRHRAAFQRKVLACTFCRRCVFMFHTLERFVKISLNPLSSPNRSTRCIIHGA